MNICIGISVNIDDVPKNKIENLDILFVSERIETSNTDLEWLTRVNPNTYFIDGKYCFYGQEKSETKHPFKKIGTGGVLKTVFTSIDFEVIENNIYLPEHYPIVFVSSSWRDNYVKRSLLISAAYVNKCYVISCNDIGPSYCFDPKGECVFGEYTEYPSVMTLDIKFGRKDD